MTCFFCKGDMELSTTTHTVDYGEGVIVIRHVPCFRCKKCGEVVYTGTVVERLEQITAELKKSLEEVNVVNYTAAKKGGFYVRKIQKNCVYDNRCGFGAYHDMDCRGVLLHNHLADYQHGRD